VSIFQDETNPLRGTRRVNREIGSAGFPDGKSCDGKLGRAVEDESDESLRCSAE
jgi:hypothetical protein